MIEQSLSPVSLSDFFGEAFFNYDFDLTYLIVLISIPCLVLSGE